MIEISHWEVWRLHNAGENPRFCYSCLDDLDYTVRRNHRLAPVIHHVNENHDDNSWLNLVPLHHGCHVRLHMGKGESQRRLATLDRQSESYREGQRVSAKRRMTTPEGQAGLERAQAAAQSEGANEKRRASLKAWARTPEGQAALKRAGQARKKT